MPAQTMPHIWRDASNEAWIDDTGYKVVMIAGEHLAHGWSAEALHENHPDLSLAQIHAALAWFYDHLEEMESQIQAGQNKAESILETWGDNAVQQRLSRLKAQRVS
ncbi:MAG TPA: DUF433 domain-containing protein [Prosthecobacter sp.]|nr:DUF433 domain-containing protein [Prosthecobacter sp.]